VSIHPAFVQRGPECPCVHCLHSNRDHISRLDSSQLSWIANFIWGIADDVLRDLYVGGKYRDVFWPMTVWRRLDAVLEPTQQAVLDMEAKLDASMTDQDQALRRRASSRSATARARPLSRQLKADFDALDGDFSPKV
jgi:type I restriction enzyme M protein